MPSQLEPQLEERFGDLLDQLRAANVEPSTELRERVRLMGRLEPAPRRPLFRRRTLVLAFAGAVLTAAVVVGVVQRGDRQSAEEFAGQATPGKAGGAQDSVGAPESTAPLAGRLQDFRAELTVSVDDAGDLPETTRRAMRVAESLGGYVVSAAYDGGASNSLIVLRVPIARAQEAITRLTALGELAGQRFSLQDLQATVDQLDAQADRLEARIAELEDELRDPKLTPRERANLRSRLDQTQTELENVLAQRDGTVAQGQTAEITLTLTAERKVPDTSQGVIDRAVDALTSVWTWVLAVLIVGAPFAVLLVAAFLLGRRLRRRANERLLGG
jgi:uncharacterized protein DUF4349